MQTIKRIISISVALCIIFTPLSISASAKENTINVSQSVIIISEAASITEEYAAQRLQYYLTQITSREIPIKTDNESFDYEICIGNTDRSDAFPEGSADGSYTITSDNNRIYINGSGNKGAINGIYAFLEKFADCHWYEAEVIVIPENEDLCVPCDINISYTPFFEYTETDTRSARDAEFSIANGLTGGIYKNLTPEQGGAVEYIGSSSHTLVNSYCKPSDYYAEHPEYFALVDGKRITDQLCLTNEDVKDIVTAEALEMLKKQHDPTSSLQILSITQNDNGNYCQCDGCSNLDNLNGSPAGTMLTFVNEIAARIKASGNYENVAIDTFAYQYTRKAPTQVLPREDVIVRLCSIECCFGHTLDDPDCEKNAEFMADLSEWSKICDRLYIWNYNLNCDESVNIYANFGVLQRDTQIFYEHNVKGIYQQGIFYYENCDTEFFEMKTYLLSRLMMDPYLDYEKEKMGYLTAVYGPGGKYIYEFIDIITEHSVSDITHLYIEQDSRFSLLGMTPCEVEHCNELWEMAKAEAQTDEQLKRILRSEISWRYWKCSTMRSEFSRLQHPYLWMKANKELYNDLVDMGITRLGERTGHDISHNDLRHLTRRIYTWITLYDEPVWDAINPLAVSVYNFLEKCYNLTSFFRFVK